MKLKVTKSAKNHLCEHSTVMMMMMDESVIVSSVVVFFCVDISPHFSPLDGLERSKTVHGGLMHCVHGGLLLTTVCVSDGLERSHLWVVIFSWALALSL